MTLLDDDHTTGVQVPHRTWRDLPASPPVADLVPPPPPGIPLPPPLLSEDPTLPMAAIAGDGNGSVGDAAVTPAHAPSRARVAW